LSVWFVIPSKRPVPEVNACLDAWHERGYRTAVLREPKDGLTNAIVQLSTSAYQGWPRSVNLLVGYVCASASDADWFVSGGDDYWPDPNKTADEIAAECKDYFATRLPGEVNYKGGGYDPLFGVMQPTGDRWGELRAFDAHGQGLMEATIDRIAGSPWMGREFCRRMYSGAGPLYNGYFHNFADEELQCVAQKLGVFWQRRDLTQEHRHWARPRGDWRDAPEWARKINHPLESDWMRSKALFAARKAAGFPGHEPLEI
jgi:hypothetical protein